MPLRGRQLRFRCQGCSATLTGARKNAARCTARWHTTRMCRRAVDSRSSVVVLTHNRVDEVLRSIARLTRDVPESSIVVVDNGSRDGTSGALARSFPNVTVVRAGTNLGAAGRNL